MAEPQNADAVVLRDQPASGVVRLTLNRPAARNALNTALRLALAEAFNALRDDDSVRCVVLRGSGGCFAAGADLKEMAPLSASGMARLPVVQAWQAIASFPKPLIAAVTGPALGGGCELVQHADIIVAGRSARFGQPEVSVGIMPGGGATQRLVRALGYWRAMRIVMTGEPIGADEALLMGLVSEVVDDERLDARALEIAQTLASRPPLALRAIKQAALAGADAPLATGLALERRAFELLFDTEDQKEGMRAFAERRAAVFNGR